MERGASTDADPLTLSLPQLPASKMEIKSTSPPSWDGERAARGNHGKAQACCCGEGRVSTPWSTQWCWCPSCTALHTISCVLLSLCAAVKWDNCKVEGIITLYCCHNHWGIRPRYQRDYLPHNSKVIINTTKGLTTLIRHQLSLQFLRHFFKNPYLFHRPQACVKWVWVVASLLSVFQWWENETGKPPWDPICKFRDLSTKVALCASLVLLHQNCCGQASRWDSSSSGI